MALPRFVAPASVLLLFGVLLPARLPGDADTAAGATCLAIAEGPPSGPDVRLDDLQACSRLYPDDAELLAELGLRYERLNRSLEAESAYTRALDLDPEYAELRLSLGRLLLARGAAAEARMQAEAGLRVQPNRQAFVELLARCTEANGNGW